MTSEEDDLTGRAPIRKSTPQKDVRSVYVTKFMCANLGQSRWQKIIMELWKIYTKV